jgi:hypothetical protein
MAVGGAREGAVPAVLCAARTPARSATGLLATGSAAGTSGAVAAEVAGASGVDAAAGLVIADAGDAPVTCSPVDGAPKKASSRANRTGNDRSTPRYELVAMAPQ